MKKEFTKDYILENKGCYNKEQVIKLSFIDNKTITLTNIINSEISLKDKLWFLRNKTELNLNQKKILSLLLAECVLEIYNKKYPNDDRVSKCIQGIKDFNNNIITKEEFYKLKENCWKAKNDAYAAAFAAADAAYAAYAAAAADAAAKKSLASKLISKIRKEKTYQEKLIEVVLQFIDEN